MGGKPTLHHTTPLYILDFAQHSSRADVKEVKSVGKPDVLTPKLGVTPPHRGRGAANPE